MQTVIYTNLFDTPVEIKESFMTTKKRLLDGQAFMEVTDMKKNKILYNKAHVAIVVAEESVGAKVVTKKRLGNK